MADPITCATSPNLYVCAHAVYDVIEHHVEHMIHEHQVHTRELKESRDAQPAPAPAVRIRG